MIRIRDKAEFILAGRTTIAALIVENLVTPISESLFVCFYTFYPIFEGNLAPLLNIIQSKIL